MKFKTIEHSDDSFNDFIQKLINNTISFDEVPFEVEEIDDSSYLDDVIYIEDCYSEGEYDFVA